MANSVDETGASYISKLVMNGTAYTIKDEWARAEIDEVKSAVTGGVHFRGVSSTAIADNEDLKEITLSGGGTVAVADQKNGDIFIYNNGTKNLEFIVSGGKYSEFGSTGEAVRKLQNRLDALGYKPGYTDGKFGAGTEAAVMAFQANNNLTVDGKAGPATQRVLYGSAKKSGVDYASLRMGDTGSAVKNLQYTLYELGYYDGAIDGIYGQTTSDAVRAFQIENSLKPVDGIAGNATQGRLYSSSAIPASKAGDLYDTVRPGATGDVVVQIQDCLASYSYLPQGNVNGVYDDATVAAVKAFQAAHGLKADGICGNRTLSVLFGY